MRPPAASTNRRVSVAMPDSRCRKLSAVRSAVSSAAADAAHFGDDVARRAALAVGACDCERRTAGSSCRNASTATSRPARRSRDLARNTPRARCRRIDRRLGRDVAPAEILGERAADDLAIERRDRAARTARVFMRRVSGTVSAGASVDVHLQRLRRPPISSRWISPDARRSASTDGSSASIAAGARTTTTGHGRLERTLFFGLLLPDCAEHGGGELAAPRRRVGCSAPPQVDSTSSARRPRRLVDRPVAATTTRLPRSRTAGTARTAAAAPRAPSAARRSPTPRRSAP